MRLFRQGAGNWTPWHAVRLRGLVSATLSATLLSVLPPLLYAATNDAGRAFSIGSGLMALYIGFVLVVRERQMARARVARSLISALLLTGFIAILVISVSNAIWWASLAGFATPLIIELGMAFTLFYSLLAETTARD